MLAKIKSAVVSGITAHPVEVEVNVSSRGLPKMTIVGLPDAAVKEARERVSTALKNSGYSFPSGAVTVNLAPADIRKEGALYDLPIAMGMLVGSEQLVSGPEKKCAMVGELALDGTLRPVKGVLPIALMLHPFNYILAFLAFLFRFDVFSAMYARMSTNILRTTINIPANAVLMGLFPESYRAMVRPFLRGTVVRIGLFLGSGLILFSEPLFHPRSPRGPSRPVR